MNRRILSDEIINSFPPAKLKTFLELRTSYHEDCLAAHLNGDGSFTHEDYTQDDECANNCAEADSVDCSICGN